MRVVILSDRLEDRVVLKASNYISPDCLAACTGLCHNVSMSPRVGGKQLV